MIIKMLKLLSSLIPQMILAIITGVIGFLFAFGITVFSVMALLSLLGVSSFSLSLMIKLIIASAVLRSFLHYLEQYFNHLIAFKILALLRIKLFSAMRRLAPQKLQNRNYGDLISLIMGDIELLEVFYAHTISPVSIAFIISVIIFIYNFSVHPLIALLGIISQVTIGIIIPLIDYKKSKASGVDLRDEIANLNSDILDNIQGIKDAIQYNKTNLISEKIKANTLKILSNQKEISKRASSSFAWVDFLIVFFTSSQMLLSYSLNTGVQNTVIVTTLTLTSFAPFLNLSNLSAILVKTFACAKRVFSLLEESPEIKEKVDGIDVEFDNIDIDNISFKYNDEEYVIKDIDLKINKGDVIGIMGESGSGKTTILKLMMRFWDTLKGEIRMNSSNIKDINTHSLYSNYNYLTQKAELFTGTIRDNMKIAKEDATDNQIVEALKKASIYDEINSLDDIVLERGLNFSSGQAQRLGLARCFLSDRPVFLLDEPTSNLDSQNEAYILKSLVEQAKEKTIINVSHRKSTLGVCKTIFEIGRKNV